MKKQSSLKRRAFFVDDRAVKRLRRSLGVKSDSEAVRLAIDFADDMKRFWNFMDRTRGTLEPESFSEPQG